MAAAKETSRTLVLFDIDGTLVRRAGPHHRQVLEDAVERVTGLACTTNGIPVQGMLDSVILKLMMRQAGAPESRIRRSLPEVMEVAQRLYTRRCPDIRRSVCPGVRNLLSRLRRAGIPTGLVTGNLSRIGWKKLERAGLKHYFRFGFFAEQANDRAGLTRLAIAHATGEGWITAPRRITLIGDHPNDVDAARRNQIHSIAVATGLSSRDQLEDCRPTHLVADMREIRLHMLRGKSVHR
ncbi:MAG: HAD hydrolase-like protein [bacterium]|nr:HAD hydrolase-like protein [bacterium]